MMRITEKKKLPDRAPTCNLFCFSDIKTLNLHDELIEHRRVQPRMQALIGSIIFDILQDIHLRERDGGRGVGDFVGQTPEAEGGRGGGGGGGGETFHHAAGVV